MQDEAVVVHSGAGRATVAQLLRNKVVDGAREAQAPTFAVTPKDWQRLVDRYGGRCAYCDTEGPLTRDHVVPLSRGGSHGIGNLLPVCGPCNYSKSGRLLVEWRRHLSRRAAA